MMFAVSAAVLAVAMSTAPSDPLMMDPHAVADK
jgi:hypothetical protein